MKKLLSLFVVLSVAFVSFANGHKTSEQQLLGKADLRMSQTLRVSSDVVSAKPMKAPAAVLTDTTLSCDSVSCTYYSSSYYSQTGKYDYYFYFHNMADTYPIIFLDLYLPTDTGLVAGYYTSEDGYINVDEVILAQDYYDYLYAYYGYPSYTFTDAIMQIDDNGDGTWTFTVILTDDEGNTYEASVTQGVAVGESTYDPSTEDDGDDDGDDDTADYSYESTTVSTINRTYTSAEANWDDTYYSQYGDVDLKITAANGSDAAAFYFYVSSYTNNQVPAGTYTIDSSADPGTVEASAGIYSYSGYTYILPAYYGTLDADGYIDEVWFIVSGTATVSYDAAGVQTVVINATSAYGSTINITVTGATVDVENVESAADFQKVIENGQLYIIKNGVRYNALGAVVE